jgi:response regulator RpfG family c-di-GMP phosphodiesterase
MGTNHQTMTEALAELERSTRATIEVLLRYFMKDNRTLCDHVHRVAHLSASVALLCGAREPEVSTIEWAALLHHAGESDMFKRSNGMVGRAVVAPNGGGWLELVRSVPSLAASAELVAALHKRYTRGMPEDRFGMPVPFGVRVIAVCDRFEELTVGPNAVSQSKALAMIAREHAAFDASVVDALCRLRGVESPQVAAVTQPARSARDSRILRHVPKPNAPRRHEHGYVRASAFDAS